MAKKFYTDTETYDIVVMCVSYMRLAETKFAKVTDYLSNEGGEIEWKNFPQFREDIITAFQQMNVQEVGDYWEFISCYLFGYYQNDVVLQIDICNKYLKGELDRTNEDDINDIQWVESGFRNDTDIQDFIDLQESELFMDALYDFFIRTNHR